VRCHASNRGDIDGLGAWAGRQSIPNTEDHFTSRYRIAFGAIAPALVRAPPAQQRQTEQPRNGAGPTEGIASWHDHQQRTRLRLLPRSGRRAPGLPIGGPAPTLAT